MSLSLDEIASMVYDGVTGAIDFPDATLTKVTPGTRTPGDLAGGTNATTATYTTKGIEQPGTDRDFTGTGWALTRRERCIISLFGAPLIAAGVAPEVDDLVTINGKTWIIKVQDGDGRDPARAMYILQCVGA